MVSLVDGSKATTPAPGGRTEVSREDVRRTALAQLVSATGANVVLTRLTAAGIVRRPDDEVSPGPRTAAGALAGESGSGGALAG